MKLVVNTNRIIASLIRDSTSRSIMKSPKLKFATIYLGEKEILKYKKEIMDKAKISEQQFDKIKEIALKNIETISDLIIQDKMPQAKEIMDKIDEKDTPFIAAALSIKNDGIWSDDRHFEKQDKIKVWNTRDLMDYIKSQ